MLLSLVIPIYNEEDNIKPLIDSIDKSIKDIEYEVIFVNDGSYDKSLDNLIKYTKDKSNYKIISFKRNFGQTASMAAGIDAAIGKYIATMDGDLQNDPADIPDMLKKIQKDKLDIVAGIRAKRKDGMFLRKIPSKIANMLIRKITKVNITDYGCTLKLFKSDIAKSINLYGELHRFIPVLARLEGAKIDEMPVKHHARIHGTTKYGIGRTFKVVSDLLLMFFFINYRQKPMHLFGNLGFFSFLAGGAIESYLLLLKILGHDIGNRPLFYVGILLIITGVQLITTGFLSEILMRTYYESQNKRPYNIKNTYISGKKTKSKD